jgi:phage shock protein PspC (stress-responsive transcriptional regulator)
MTHTVLLKTNGERYRFYRVPSRWVGGVCQGLSDSFNLKPEYLRLIWFFSLLFSMGAAVLIYVVFWWVLPLETELVENDEPKFLGVCYELAKRSDWEVTVVRLFVVASVFISLGITLLAYFALYLFFALKD